MKILVVLSALSIADRESLNFTVFSLNYLFTLPLLLNVIRVAAVLMQVAKIINVKGLRRVCVWMNGMVPNCVVSTDGYRFAVAISQNIVACVSCVNRHFSPHSAQNLMLP